MSDFIIIANGPFLAKDLIKEAMDGRRVLALDGAVNSLYKYAIKPDIILGDFDSVNAKTGQFFGIKAISENGDPYFGVDGVLIVPAPDQNYTDLEKGIHYCDELGAESIRIVCATGGRLDHHEALRETLKQEYNPRRRIVVYTDMQSMCYARDETLNINGKSGDICGFVGLDAGVVTAEGLKYPCVKRKTSFANEMLGSVAKLEVSGGALIILPPQLDSQRS